MPWSRTWASDTPTTTAQARDAADAAYRKGVMNLFTVVGLLAVWAVLAGIAFLADEPRLPSQGLPLALLAALNGPIAAMNFAQAGYYRTTHDRLAAAGEP